MACDTRVRIGQQIEERRRQVAAAVKKLEAALQSGKVSVVIDKATGAVAFYGWEAKEREDVADLCAYRKLSTEGSWALKQAVQKAEALAGRKVDQRQLNAGTHSHDGGATWSPGHGGGFGGGKKPW
jgi:hypothetical protein